MFRALHERRGTVKRVGRGRYGAAVQASSQGLPHHVVEHTLVGMEHRIAHSLDQELIRKVARKAVESYAQRFAEYSPQATWETDDRAKISFSAKGITLDGSITLEPKSVLLNLNVPFLLKPFAGKATGVIEEQVKHWIEVAKRGEL